MYYLVVTFSITYMSAHLGMETSTILSSCCSHTSCTSA